MPGLLPAVVPDALPAASFSMKKFQNLS